MTDENNQIKLFLYENWARTKTGQHTVLYCVVVTTSKVRVGGNHHFPNNYIYQIGKSK